MKDTKNSAKKKKLISSDDEGRGGNASSTGKKGRNKVNQEKETRKGQKVIIHSIFGNKMLRNVLDRRNMRSIKFYVALFTITSIIITYYRYSFYTVSFFYLQIFRR